jgi:hypothetical protein
MALAGDVTPVLPKHSKSFSLIDCISVGVGCSSSRLEVAFLRRSGEGVQARVIQTFVRYRPNWPNGILL